MGFNGCGRGLVYSTVLLGRELGGARMKGSEWR